MPNPDHTLHEEGLKTANGHFYIRDIKSFEDEIPTWRSKLNGLFIEGSPVSIKNFDWVNFSDLLHFVRQPPEEVGEEDEDLIGSLDFGKEVIMTNWNGEWRLAYAYELINTVCVYNIKPDETCSQCPDEAFCKYTGEVKEGSERKETICVCQNTFEGENCEVDLCSNCQNGGFCERSNNDVQCRCPYPFYGKYCESKIFEHFFF